MTDALLIRMGFEPGKFKGDLVRGPILRGVNKEIGKWYWAVRSYPIPDHAAPKTEEQLRLLCTALGVHVND